MPARGDSVLVPLIRDARAEDAAALARLLGQLGYPADSVGVTTSEQRADAHAFYERMGLEHTGRRFAKRLSA